MVVGSLHLDKLVLWHTEDGSALNHPTDVVEGGEAALAGCNHGFEVQLVTTMRDHLESHQAAVATH